MKRFLAVLTAVLFLVPVAAFAAGTCTTPIPSVTPGQSVYTYTTTCTADAADGSYPATAIGPIDGWIISVETDPGTVTPTALWDLTLLDARGADVMAGVLANRSATATEKVISPQPYVLGMVTVTPTNNSVNSAVFVLITTVLR